MMSLLWNWLNGIFRVDKHVPLNEQPIENTMETPYALTAEQLKQIAPDAKQSDIDKFLPFINQYAEQYAINTKLRMCMFLAQVLHESGNLRYTREIWGPTAQQKRYERDFSKPWKAGDPTNGLAFELGNSEKGDGAKFKGHGLIQTTGRANHLKTSIGLFNDGRLIHTPELLTLPDYAVMSAMWYWKARNLNQFADAQDVQGATRRINGGLNGLAHRQEYYKRAKAVL